MSDTERFEIGENPRLFLHHYTRATAAQVEKRTPVLLLHGASANHRTFLTGHDGGLAHWLAPYRDVWMLDWRGSGLVLDEECNQAALEQQGDLFNFNEAAGRDLEIAIEFIRAKCQVEKVSALGFCMGAAVLSEAIALGVGKAACLDYVVLMTLGLFYETPIDGRLKGEDRILERLRGFRFSNGKSFVSVDPRVAESKLALRAVWPPVLDSLYQDWPPALKSHEDKQPEPGKKLELDPVLHMCNRVSFMYGAPYYEGNLVKAIHDEPAHGSTCVLEELFGAIPLHMYINGARNIRQGHATIYNKEKDSRPDTAYVSSEAQGRFRSLSRLTLITGALNRLWHRDSIDRMYEWLRRGSPEGSDKIEKHVIPGYGHQDLLWGTNAPKDVFCRIKKGLGIEDDQCKAGSAASASRQRAASHGMPSRDAAASPRR